MVSIRAVSFDPKGSVQTVTFDGMDVRSEGLVDDYIATFKQGNLDIEHEFSDSFKMTMSAGRSINTWDGPKRLQTFIDAIDTDNFTLDFRGGRETPLIGFGFDVGDPNNFIYAPTNDGNQTVVGGYSFQGKPSRNVTANTVFELDGDRQMNDTFKLKGGLQWRENNYKARVSGILAAQTTTQALPAGTSLADYTLEIKNLDDLFGSGAPSSWVAMDPDKWAEAFNYPEAFNFCGIECGANRSGIIEEVTSANGVPLTFTKDDLVDLSPNTASMTLFYDNGTFSVRTTGSYRDAYIRGLPASAGSDVRGNKANLFVDASASWNVNDHFTLILEAQNLTDERNTLFIDRAREDTLFQTEIGRTVNFGATFKF